MIRSVWDADLAAAPAATEGPPGANRGRRLGDAVPDPRTVVWIGMRFESGRCPAPEPSGRRSLPFLTEEREGESRWNRFFALAAGLAEHARDVSGILGDAVTGLPGRVEFQAKLDQARRSATETGKPPAMMFVNPDDFAIVNERYGRSAGDEVIREVATRLRSTVRQSDHIAKYGGAIFTCLLIDTPLADAKTVANKILRTLSEASFLKGAIRLGFSVGAASSDQTGVETSLDLIRRADQALNAAKRSGGSQVCLWKPGSEMEEAGNLDRLTGIFTGNMAKDYRNMVLLWDSVRVVAAGSDFEDLAARMVERLRSTVKPGRVAILSRTDEGQLELVSGRESGDHGGAEPASFSLTSKEAAFVEDACEQGRALQQIVTDTDPLSRKRRHRSCFAVPLSAHGASLGCLYLDGLVGSLRLDASDQVFLEALAAQLTVALDRARLAEQERLRQSDERKRLSAELDDLRRAVQVSKMNYQSKQMDELLATARRIAPTDATVLITGESGTGKEVLARTIHELSSRRSRPLVIVDCGAISATLIDSELFGHEKGAFTGAQNSKVGRLAEANGATILLDEIGELPLDVQSKLLRFVQERQLTPVGSSRPRTVDVRIIAATNVDLSGRVAEGSFREDLFHRLNVVTLNVPALRERPDDILHLANHYLQTYATMYRKAIREISPEARALLSAYGWPGNIRELQNRIMQAVLLCEGSVLGPGEFGGLAARVEISANDGEVDRRPAGTPAPTSSAPSAPGVSGDPLEELRAALARQIDSADDDGALLVLPLGKWLSDDLVLAADTAAKGVSRRGAAVLGIPETTYRRRLQSVSGREKTGLAPRPITWAEVRDVLARLVATDEYVGQNLLELCESILLSELVTRFPGDVKTTAALLGVTVPTARRRLEAS